MYEDFYNLNAEPFRLSPDHNFCFDHQSYAKARAYMSYAFMRAEGFVMVTGRPGTGKTTLVGELIDSLSEDNVATANLVCTQLSADDLLKTVAYHFGIQAEGTDKAELIQRLSTLFHRWHREGKRALLIVDEAQDLAIGAMEELRLLTNIQHEGQPLLQIFLLGQPELRELILSPELEQVHQRVVAACHLEGLDAQEVEAYVLHRLQSVGWSGDPAISTAVFPLIHKFSEGVPRRINLICGRLFLHGGVEQRHQIGVEDLRVVISELQSENLAAGSHIQQDDFVVPSTEEWVSVPGSEVMDPSDMSQEDISADASQLEHPEALDKKPLGTETLDTEPLRSEPHLRAVNDVAAVPHEEVAVTEPVVTSPGGASSVPSHLRSAGEEMHTEELVSLAEDATPLFPAPLQISEPEVEPVRPRPVPLTPVPTVAPPLPEEAPETLSITEPAPESTGAAVSGFIERSESASASTPELAAMQPVIPEVGKQRPERVAARPARPLVVKRHRRTWPFVVTGLLVLLGLVIAIFALPLLEDRLPWLSGGVQEQLNTAQRGVPSGAPQDSTDVEDSVALPQGEQDEALLSLASLPDGLVDTELEATFAPGDQAINETIQGQALAAVAPLEISADDTASQISPAVVDLYDQLPVTAGGLAPSDVSVLDTELLDEVEADADIATAMQPEEDIMQLATIAPADTTAASLSDNSKKAVSQPAPTEPLMLLVSFAFDSVALSDSALGVLGEAARHLTRHSTSTAYITGFADNSGDRFYNLNLSRERALAVEDYLLTAGVQRERLSVAGLGVSTASATDEESPSGGDGEQNRIVQIKILPEGI